MTTRALLLAAVFWAGCYSYSYSDSVSGLTNNAASGGPTWDMLDILPPQAGLQIGGVFYRYTVEKDPEDDFKVHIQNENAIEGGYVFRETDDWSQLPGSTINKSLPLGNIPYEYFGLGSIETEGEGNVTSPRVQYSYKFDPCYIILTNPECPGYDQALWNWLKENGLLDKEPDVNDPFYDEWVQLMMNRETDPEDEEDEDAKSSDEEEDEEQDPIEALNANVDIKGFIDGARQSEIIRQLSSVPQFENYITATIPGGAYEETISLQDTLLPDNTRALSSLARDELHIQMVRSQYRN